MDLALITGTLNGSPLWSGILVTDEPGRTEVGALRERVVDDDDGAEARGGGVGRRGLGHLHYRRVRAAHHVVPEHAEARLLLVDGGRHAGEQDESEEAA